MQDLRYTYDAVGNVVQVQDQAQQTVYFDNAVVSPHHRFEYDALYRLVWAEGREHTAQGQPTDTDLTPGPQPHPDDPAALRTYEESYAYDEVGNLLQVQHVASGGNWTRQYVYAQAGNRLLQSRAPGDPSGGPYTHQYGYDAHGNMTAMPHLSVVQWDHADRMQHADLGGGGDVYFQYDAAGTRVRKVRVNQAETAANERIYLGALELYRQRDVDTGQLADVDLERQTLHVADDTGRLVLVETLTVEDGDPVTSPANTARYQYGNHLGTVSLELDDTGAVISYEEFHPYGTSAYRAVDSSIEVSPKRYRYTGKERDEETGLDHMGARYYAPWLGRWTSADPIGLRGGINRYVYASNRPTTNVDPNGTFDFPSWEDVKQAASKKVEQVKRVASEVAEDPAGAAKGYYGGLARGVQKYAEALGERAGAILAEGEKTYYDVTTHHEGVFAGVKKKVGEAVEATVEQIASDVETVVGEGYVGTAEALSEGDLAAAAESYEKSVEAAYRLAGVVVGGFGLKSLIKKGRGPLRAPERPGGVGGGRGGRESGESSPPRRDRATPAATDEVAEPAAKGGGAPASSAVQRVNLRNQLTAQEIAGGHAFEKHVVKAGEFPGVKTPEEFAQVIENVLRNPTHVRELSKGRTAYFNENTGTLVIRNPAAPDGGTAFVPTTGLKYFMGLK